MARWRERQKSSNIDDRRGQAYQSPSVVDTILRNINNDLYSIGAQFAQPIKLRGGPGPMPKNKLGSGYAGRGTNPDRITQIIEGYLKQSNTQEKLTSPTIETLIKGAGGGTTSQEEASNILQFVASNQNNEGGFKGLTEEEILAYTLLGEAAGEGREGMAAVMHVIQNRANSGRFPSGLKDVALQKSGGTYQFDAWRRDLPSQFSKDSAEFKRALEVVRDVTSGRVADPTGGALHYYANTGANAIPRPYWFNPEAAEGPVQIGNHVFAATTPVVPRPAQPSSAVNAARYANTGQIDYLPASKEQLMAVVGRSQVPATPKVATPLPTGLVTRSVQSVPVNSSGQPVTVSPAEIRMAAAAGAYDANLTDRLISQMSGLAAQATPRQTVQPQSGVTRMDSVIVRKDGTVVPAVTRRDALPPGVRPNVPALPSSNSARENIREQQEEMRIIRQTQTVQVRNPKYVPPKTSAPGAGLSQDQLRALRATPGELAALNAPPEQLVVPEPEFIEKEIVIEKAVPVQQAAPAKTAQEVQYEQAVQTYNQRQWDLAQMLAHPDRYTPESVAAFASGSRTYSNPSAPGILLPTTTIDGRPRYTYGDSSNFSGSNNGSLSSSY